MSGIGDQGLRPADVEKAPAGDDGQEQPEQSDEQEQPDGSSAAAHTEQVPAGRAGADSGAAAAVRIDPDDESDIPDVSELNDTPGVGPGDANS